MSRKSTKVLRPSGIVSSGEGKYFYWPCTVSGLETFADAKRFAEIVKNYGSEENLAKTYVLRSVKHYVEAGYTPEAIKDIINKHGGKLPSLTECKDTPAVKKAKPVEVKQEPIIAETPGEQVPSGSLSEVKEEKSPWAGNSAYFKSEPIPFNIAEESKNSCLYPNKNLDDECRTCTIHAICQSSVRYTETDWEKPRNRKDPKIVRLNPMTGDKM